MFFLLAKGGQADFHTLAPDIVKTDLIITQLLRHTFLPCLDLRWSFNNTFWGNPLLQNSHTYGFSFVCCLIWIFKELELVNPFSQNLQMKGFSPVCVNICFLRSKTVFPHVSHSNLGLFGSGNKLKDIQLLLHFSIVIIVTIVLDLLICLRIPT